MGYGVTRGKMFYYDSVLKENESNFDWEKALKYLDLLYVKKHSEQIAATIVGFAWYYFIDGAVESKSYNLESCQIGLDYWKKYLDIGFKEFYDDPSFCFIAGYTLALHGFFIDGGTNADQEELGYSLIKKCQQTTDNDTLKDVSACFLKRRWVKKIVSSGLKEDRLKLLFDTDSLIDKYFIRIFSN